MHICKEVHSVQPVFSLQGGSQTLAHSTNIWGLAIEVPRPHHQRLLFRKSEMVIILVLKKTMILMPPEA